MFSILLIVGLVWLVSSFFLGIFIGRILKHLD